MRPSIDSRDDPADRLHTPGRLHPPNRIYDTRPFPPPRRINTFEIHTDLPVWMLDTVHDLLVLIAHITGCAVEYATVTESYHDQAADART